MQRDIDHIREIESVAQNPSASTRDPAVLTSWLRCLETHGLDPTDRRAAHIVTESELRLHRQRSEALISIARRGIDHLYKLVAGQDYVLLLSDAQGVTVEYLGEARHKEALQQGGLFIGAEWSEQRAGTCAVGACIEAGEPLIIHQSDHFDVTHGALSCTAAPIYDSAGHLNAVLDISLLSSPRPRESQFLALNLVQQAARRIEMANLMAESRSDWVLRLSGSPDFLDVDPEAAISLDASGHVIGMTHGAARLMARALGQDWRQSGAVTGKHISDIFQLDLPMMEGLTRQIPASDRLIETQDGYRLFAHAIEPRKTAPTPIRRSPSLPPALRDLAGDDPAMGQVLTTAAMLAKGRRAFLVTGETGCGKSTLIQAIHDSGSKGPAITLACESFDEDEAAAIFGREDRRQFQPGQIARAEGGLLVLDNIDELPLKFQARLVMLLTEGRYRPVGAMRERQAILRLVASISGDPAEAVAQGQLRRDLYLRLSGTHLHVPPLRARQDRLWVMERVFATAFGGKIGFEPSAIAALAGHDWPGNFHELQQIAEDAAARRAGSRARPLQASELSLPNMAEPGSALDAERATLAHHLSATDWNITQTAQILGVNRATIYRRITRFNLARD